MQTPVLARRLSIKLLWVLTALAIVTIAGSAWARRPAPGTRGVVPIANGTTHSCQVRDGTVACWGSDVWGELGDSGNPGGPFDATWVIGPSGYGLLSNIVAVGAGSSFSCGLRADGLAFCWGLGVNGQLGDGLSQTSHIPRQVYGASGIVAIAAGGSHACSLHDNGTVRCWGTNSFGQLGNGSTNGSPIPVPVSGITTAVAISASAYHTCAVLANGTASCWGLGYFGELGNGANPWTATVPVQVANLTMAREIAAGVFHTCATRADGTAWCWGNNSSGELGNGTTTNTNVPVQVSGLTFADSIAAGVTSQNTCATVIDGGYTKCWGSNTYGQLGRGGSGLSWSSYPVEFSAASGAHRVATGHHTCHVRDGSTYVQGCVGRNDYNQSSLVYIYDLGSAPPSIATSWFYNDLHSCALYRDGRAWCWGAAGFLGDGSIPYSPPSSTPVQVHSVWGALHISANFGRSGAATTTGALWTWGAVGLSELEPQQQSPGSVVQSTHNWQNNGSTKFALSGDGKVWSTESGSWTEKSGLSNVIAIDSGFSHMCALRADGQVLCWGANGSGELGRGYTSTSDPTPAPVTGLGNATSIGIGFASSCAVVQGGVKCWGQNDYGQLGNGTTSGSSAPVAVRWYDQFGPELNGVVTISGGQTACAVRSGGSVVCWGRGEYGQIGDGSNSNRSNPEYVIGLGSVVAIDTSNVHVCAIAHDQSPGRAFCWGANNFGNLGDGTTTDRWVPTPVIQPGTGSGYFNW